MNRTVCLCVFQTVKLKAEARLDLLRQVGVSVDTWLKSAMNQVMEELENERWASLPTLTTHNLSLSVRSKSSHADSLTFIAQVPFQMMQSRWDFVLMHLVKVDPLLPVSVSAIVFRPA